MSYTPTTTNVRKAYVRDKLPYAPGGSVAEFNRFIEQVRAEARAQAFQAVRDAAELEPEERDGPDMISPATLYITVDKLNGLETSHDCMDWIRITATDYATAIREAQAEAWSEGYVRSCADHGDGGKLHGANNINPYRNES